MKYAPPLGSSDPNASYADPVDGTIPAAAVEQPMREIQNVITGMGLVPGATDLTQLDQAIDLKVAAMQPDLSAFVDTGRTIATTEPLTGGGSLAADLSLGLKASSGAMPEHVILRDAQGRAQVAAPASGSDIATKDYTDSAISELESTLKALDYSLEEQWTRQFWIDGKKIYQRSFRFQDLPADESKRIVHGIPNIQEPVSITGICCQHPSASGTQNYLPLPHIGDSLGNDMSLYATPVFISVKSHQVARTGYAVTVTFQYTCTDR